MDIPEGGTSIPYWMEDPFIESCSRLVSPADNEARLREALPAWQQSFTSDDYVDYTWHAPTARLFTGRPSLRPARPGYEYPAWTRKRFSSEKTTNGRALPT